jgi:hypothetical protein
MHPLFEKTSGFAYAEPDDASLKAAAANGWMVVNMKSDWKKIFAFENK